MTRPDHRTGTDRVAEVAAHIEAEIYVNVQGDEPLIDPGTVDALVEAMLENSEMHIGTPCSAIDQPNDIMDPNIVKVVRDFDSNALYFSRAPIPWVRDTRKPLRQGSGSILDSMRSGGTRCWNFPRCRPGSSKEWNSSSNFAGLRTDSTLAWLRPITTR